MVNKFLILILAVIYSFNHAEDIIEYRVPQKTEIIGDWDPREGSGGYSINSDGTFIMGDTKIVILDIGIIMMES